MLALVMLPLLPEAAGAWVEAQVSVPPEPSSKTEKLIDEAHKLTHQLRGDHQNVHDSAGYGSAVVAAQISLHDRAAPMLARLDDIKTSDLMGLSDVWQMLYFETRSTIEWYLACAAQSPDNHLTEKAKASVADGEKAIALLKRIRSKKAPADVWILEDQKEDVVRWHQAAAEGIIPRSGSPAAE